MILGESYISLHLICIIYYDAAMPKIIELTVELEVQKVSCPGVWLCQDGRVSLTIFVLGTSYQTCSLPPTFPLMFKDVFYFRKQFQESCALNNICCILKDEAIYCELVQWSDDCRTGDCTVLAQYLGALNDVLFPPTTCSNDGVDLLMKRSKEFPGILSPKIEIATKVRIDEVWEQPCNVKAVKVTSCQCSRDTIRERQQQVCHTTQYHRNKCNKRITSSTNPRSRSRSKSQGSIRSDNSLTPERNHDVICECSKSKCNKRIPSMTNPRSRSRSRSQGSNRSCSSLTPERHHNVSCECSKRASSPNPRKSHVSLSQNPRQGSRRKCQYNVYNIETMVGGTWPNEENTSELSDHEAESRRLHTKSYEYKIKPIYLMDENRTQKQLLESRYIDQEPIYESKLKNRESNKHFRKHIAPCVCEICRRYHELFHVKS